MAKSRSTPPPTADPDVGALRGVVRLIRLALHLWRGLYRVRVQFPGLVAPERQQRIGEWSRQALQLLGVHLRVLGQPPEHGPVLVVCNHLSWLDILVLNASWPCRFVSKADVRHWPVMGHLVAGSGTLFIERDKRRDALRVVHQMSERLREGDVLAVFPEGTTGDGQGVLPFHANLLQAAVSVDSPVIPAGVAYHQGDGQTPADAAPRHPAPLYTGDTSLVASLWRTACAQDVQATLQWGEAEQAQGRDRRTWADALRREVARLSDQPLADAHRP